MLFSTVFSLQMFIEVDVEGDLEKYLQRFWTKKELREYMEHRMDLWIQG